MVALNVRIPDELNNILVSSAKKLERPKGYIVRKALEGYLQELQEDMEDYNDALKRLAKKESTIALEEVIERLGFSEELDLKNA